MAEELVSKWASKSFFKQFDDAIPNLEKVVDLIAQANAAGRNSEGLMKQAGSLKEVATQQRALVDAQGNLVSSYQQLSKAAEIYTSWKARSNGSTETEIAGTQKVIRLKQEEEKARRATNQADLEAERIRTQAAKTSIEKAKATTESAKATLNEAKAATENAKQRDIERRYIAALTKEQERLTAAKEKEQAKLAEQQTALGRVKAEYKEAAGAAEELGAQYFLLAREIEQLEAAQAKGSLIAPGANAAADIGMKKIELDQLSISLNAAQANAMKLHTGLLSIEQAVGKSQRNVGNYNNSLFALSQILREAPAFAYGFQTGLSALSNNLPILADEFTRVKNATGSTMAAVKIFGASLFSISNILPLAFAGIMLLVSAFSAHAKSAKEANHEIGDYERSLKSISESAGREVGALNELLSKAQDVSASYKSRSDAIDELQRKYPDVFANLEREQILNGDVADAYDAVSASILRRAETQAKADIITKAIQDRTKAQLELDEATNQSSQNFWKYTQQDVDALRLLIKEKNDLIESTKKSLQLDQQTRAQAYWLDQDAKKRYEEAQAEARRRALLTEEQREEEDKRKRQKAPTDFTNEELKAQADETKALYDQLKIRAQIEADSAKAIADNDSKTQQERLDANDVYTQKRIEIAGYELSAELDITQQKLDKIAEIEKKDAAKRTNEEKRLLLQKDALLLQQGNIYGQFELAQNKLVAENGQFRVGLTEKYARQAKKNLADMAAIVGNNNFDDGGDRQKDIENRNKKLQEAYQLGAEFANNLASLNSALTQRRVQEIDAEIAKINEKRDAEIAGIEASTLSEDEKQKKIAAIKANADAQEKALETDKRARQRRAAQFEKSITIAEIIAETALAVMRALSDKLVPFPARIATAIAVGAIGAGKLAVALAAPLPSYEHGTRGKAHPGGPAMLFEGNKPELVMEPGKKPWMGRMQGVYELAKGAEVISNKQLKDIARFYTLGLPALIPQQGYPAVDFGQLQEEMKGVKQAIKDKPVAQLNVTGMGMQRLTRQANNITEYIKSFSC